VPLAGYAARPSRPGALEAAALGDVLAEPGTLSGRFAAVRAAILARFDACRGYAADGYARS
jgi:hypothetical protein